MDLKEKLFQSWSTVVDDKLITELESIIEKLKIEYRSKIIFPHQSKIFRAFKEMPINECKTILIGFDPYNNVYKNEPSACGLSFVTENGYVNPSLDVLSKSLQIKPFEFRDFAKKNGILLLNVYLTVEKGNPGSHRNIWSEFSNMLINKISKEKRDLNWILLGNDAKTLKSEIVFGNIYTCIHPAAYAIAKAVKYKELENIWLQLGYKENAGN